MIDKKIIDEAFKFYNITESYKENKRTIIK